MIILDAIAFNSDIGNWNISKVTAIYDMFSGASKFNQNINTKEVTLGGTTYTAWDVSKKIAYGVFRDAIAFNQPLDKWNNLILMRNMFDGATSFNQEIRMWDISKVENNGFDNMVRGAVAFKEAYYEDTLTKWNLDTGTLVPQFWTTWSPTVD